MINTLWPVVLTLSLAFAIISVTLTKGKIFRKQRLWVAKRSPWAYSLLSCPYCTSHWIVALGFSPYHPRLLYSGAGVFLDYTFSLFFMIGVTVLLIGLILSLFQFSDDKIEQAVDSTLVKRLRTGLSIAKEEIISLGEIIKEKDEEILKLRHKDDDFVQPGNWQSHH